MYKTRRRVSSYYKYVLYFKKKERQGYSYEGGGNELWPMQNMSPWSDEEIRRRRKVTIQCVL